MTGYIWNMKRRNIDCAKMRRPVKKSKLSDGLYGSLFLYAKFLLVWVLVLAADFLLEFRFEYLWPVWLLLHSTFDSFRYQGFIFSVLFVCISLAADVICYLFVPIQWLYFAASTYVWVQYVWHSDRGLCIQTVSLWFLCVYIEMSLRLKDFKCLPMFQFDLCRPFAAHCIGYPVITLGFGCKTYFAYKLRLRKQKSVQKSNSFYSDLMQQSLPADQFDGTCQPLRSDESSSSFGTFITDMLSQRKTRYQPDSDCSVTAGSANISYCYNSDVFEESDTNFESHSVMTDVNDFRDNEQQHNNSKLVYKATVATATKNCLSSGAAKSDNITTASTLKQMYSNNRDDVINRLKSDLKRAKADLQTSRITEQELRSQLNNMSTNERSTKTEIEQLRHDNDSLQSKLHNLVATRQQEKQSLSTLERKLQEERKVKSSLEHQLTAERKKNSEILQQTIVKVECSDFCRNQRSELEMELKQTSWQVKCREEQLLQLQTDMQLLHQYKDCQQNSEMLMTALVALKDKNSHLESSLSAETRIKMDLFSALGETKRQIELQHSLLLQKDALIGELKSKVAEVMALVPSSGFNSLCSAACSSHSTVVSQSTLNPQASDYQPRLSPM